MSEYQYYEFVAIDQPLSPAQQKELRRFSTRAEITSTRFSNEYHWGNFRGDPDEMMARYFDAMVYVTNWGSRRFMLRLPKGTVAVADCKAYCCGYNLRCKTTAHHVIIDFQFDIEDSEMTEDAEGWLPSLVSLRAELLRGDLRALYLGWLGCVQMDELDEESREPPVPSGLGSLSAPLLRLAEFIELDEDLLAVAAEGSMDETEPAPGLAEFIAALPSREKDKYLLDWALGKGPQLGAHLSARFRASLKKGRRGSTSARRSSGRTVSELLEAADHRRADRRSKEARRAAREKARRDAQAAQERARYLDELAPRADLAWQKMEQNILALKPKLYREVAQMLVDLRDLAVRQGGGDIFQSRLTALIERHRGKSALMRELRRASLIGTQERSASSSVSSTEASASE